MKGAIIQNHDTETGFILSREVVKENLEAISIESRHLKEKTITSRWFYCTVDIVVLEAMLYLLYWLYSSKGNTPTWVGHQAESTLILDENFGICQTVVPDQF